MSETNKTRPQFVNRAILILFATLAVGLVRSVMEFPRMAALTEAAGHGPGYLIFLQAFTFIVMALIFFLISDRRNWARIVFLVLTILGIPFSISPLLKSLSSEPMSGLLGICQTIGEIVALVLLFTKPSNEWYKKQAENPQAPGEE